MAKKNTRDVQKLTSKDLQIEILKFLLSNSSKRYSARQIIDSLQIGNNRDSAEHALQQLTTVGAVREFQGQKFAIALDRFTVDEGDGGVEEMPAAPAPTGRAGRKGREVREEWPSPAPFESEAANGIPVRERAGKDRRERGQKSRSEGRKFMEGRVDMTRTGAAYIVSEMQDTDVYVAPKHINGALHGDTVKVLLFAPPPRRHGQAMRKPEGEVVEVLKRAHEFFIGTLHRNRKYALVQPDNPNMVMDIYVPLEAVGDAQDGDKVVVKITDWQEGKGRVPIGKVTQTLGAVGGNDFEMKKILVNAGFELSHTEASMAEAARIPDTISPQEIERRRDFRHILTFTIDPEDAKDFDDALSIHTLENGHIEIGVHIADVTHYLKPDTPLDKEAFRRSTSVYLVDRVSPMLPEKLSNHLCSLVPHQDRLTFSAVFTFDQKDHLVKRWFGKTVIHSAHRFSYEAAQLVLEKKPPENVFALEIFPQLDWALQTLNRMAKKMRKQREKQGAISFETEEVRFRLAQDGTPIEAYVKERKDAHMLIEDFMLLANKEVALYIDEKAKGQPEIPFVYRIHDLPDMVKVAEFARFAYELGHPMKVDTPQQIAQSYNSLMHAAKNDDRLKLLEPLAIRTMAKAVYSTNNIGHYGLGFSHYSHFTSPIRRYSDVLAHRILERNLDGKVARVDKDKLEESCKHISLQERKAADAERESVKYKQAELISRHLGEVFEGIISGMIERGIFVELPGSKAEGMIDFKGLADSYSLEDGNMRAKGRRHGRVFRMGDRLQVRVRSVDLNKRQIDLELAEEE
jgi:ribonuclease R